MRRDDCLATAFPSHFLDQDIDFLLQHYVLMGIGFIKQHHGSRAGVEKGQEKKYLEGSAPGIGDIQRTLLACLGVLAHDERLARAVNWLQQIDLKQIADVTG